MEEGRNESHSNLFPINDALADLFAHAFILSFLSDRAKSICTVSHRDDIFDLPTL